MQRDAFEMQADGATEGIRLKVWLGAGWVSRDTTRDWEGRMKQAVPYLELPRDGNLPIPNS